VEKVEDDAKICLSGCFSKGCLLAFYASKNVDLLTAEIENDSLPNIFTLFILKKKTNVIF
jgi:hypothetical protein